MKQGDIDTTKILDAVKDVESKLSTRIEERLEEIKEHGQASVKDTDLEIKRLEKEYKEFAEELNGTLDDIQKKLGRAELGGDEAPKSVGEIFTEHKNYLERDGGNVKRIELKDITTDPASAGPLTEPQRLPFWTSPNEPHIRDLLQVGRTSKEKIRMPRRKLRTNNAAMVAQTALKPKSDLTFEIVETTIKKIAHYVKISDEALEDIPMLANYINTELIDGLRDVEDQQILKGDGTGDNLEGLYTVAQPFSRVVAGDTMLDMFARAQTQLRLVNRSATGYVLNPQDWEEIMLLKGSDSHYIWANLIDGNGQARLMAKPVRDTTKLDKGEWLMGDFRRGARLFDRRQAYISTSRQNEDDFIKNMVSILAEERLGLFIFDPFSFIKNAPA